MFKKQRFKNFLYSDFWNFVRSTIEVKIWWNIDTNPKVPKEYHGEEAVECEVRQNLNIVDLTGAGDLFAAGFLHGYVNNLSIKQSLEKGTELSSKIIQQIGARL